MAKKPKHNPIPWDFLDEFRGEGKYFNAEWPTLKELFDITTARYPDNKAFHPSRRVGLFDKCCGSDRVRTLFAQRHKVADIALLWMSAADSFRNASQKYWLY